MPLIVVDPSTGDDIATINADCYGTLGVIQAGNPGISGIPSAMTGENFVIAVGSTTSGSVIKYTTNGTEWLDVTFKAETNFTNGFGVGYDGNGTWAAVGTTIDAASTVVYSSDSVNWQNAIPVALMARQIRGICYAPDNYWYAVGDDFDGRNTIIRSIEPNTPGKWTSGLNGEYMLSADSAYFGEYSIGDPAVGLWIASDGKNTLVASGYASPTNSGILWADTKDGTMWYNATMDDGVTFVPSTDALGYNGSIWVGSGSLGIMASMDGKLWKIVATPYSFGGYDVGWNGQYWMTGGLASDFRSAAMYYSYDGFTWEPTTVPSGPWIQGITWNGTYWVAGGQLLDQFVTFTEGYPASSFMLSQDGINWTGSTGNTFDGQVNGIANRIRLPNAAPSGSAITIMGSGAPSLNIGKPGDLYIDNNTFGLYGPKTKTETLGSNGTISFLSNYGLVYTDPSSDFLLTSDFTINFWMNPFYLQGNVFALTPSSGVVTDPGSFEVNINSSGEIGIRVDGSFDVIPNSATNYQWSYYSMVRNSTSGLILYSNGSNVYSNADYATNTIGNITSGLTLGGGFYGNITNFQWANGYADPSANVVPVAPLTALSGATLLLLAAVDLSGVSDHPYPIFTDSTGNHTMVASENVLWSGDNPFQVTTLSWGTPTFPPAQRAFTMTFSGAGLPAQLPPGSKSGDSYIDTTTGLRYIIN